MNKKFLLTIAVVVFTGFLILIPVEEKKQESIEETIEITNTSEDSRLIKYEEAYKEESFV